MYFGGAGYRSRYLSHAKRALYHLSYAPFDFINFLYQFAISEYSNFDKRIKSDVWRRRASFPVPLAYKASSSPYVLRLVLTPF